MQSYLPAHARIAGYEIDTLVGKGGMGEVYRARQLSMDRVVALKVLAARLAKQDPTFAKQFEEEARAAGRLNHPNIIAVHDVGTVPYAPPGEAPEPLHYFSMELVDGETVKEVITREGRCPLALTEAVMNGMAEALVYAEQMGVVHRDIKPDNIMVAAGGLVKLADLGLAQQIGSEEGIDEKPEAGKARRVMGTPLYMSPEQARGLVVDHRSDQYSLGATLYHMLVGIPPYSGADSKAIMRRHVFDPVPDPRNACDCPEAWRQLCVRLMAKQIGDRFATAIELRQAVRQAVAGVALAAGRRGRQSTLLTPVVSATASTTAIEPRGSSVFKWVAAAVVLGMAAVGAVVVIDWGGKPPPVSPTKDPTIKVSDVPAAPDALARVRQLVAGLPADHAAALPLIDAALAEPVNADDQSRDLLISERGRRHKAVEDRRRTQLNDQLSELTFIDRAIANGNLGLARQRLDTLAKSKITLVQARFDEVTARLGVEIGKLGERLLVDAARATTLAQLEALNTECHDSPLDAEAQAKVEQVLLTRRQELQRVEDRAKIAVRERQAWKELGEGIEPLRFSSQYGRLVDQVDSGAAKMPSPELRELALALHELSRLASEADTFLRNLLRSQGIKDQVRQGGETIDAKITDLSDKEVSYRAGTSTLDRRTDRQAANLNYERLLSAAYGALPSDKIAERRRATLAYCWFWKPGDVRALAAALPKDDALAQAVLALENHTRLLPINNRVRLDGTQASVLYDFAAVRDRGWLEDFTGSASYGARGLALTSDKPLPVNDFSEALLPGLTWKGALPVPCEVEAKLVVPPGTGLALFGIECGGQRVRFAIDTRSPDGAVAGLLVSNGDGTRFNAFQQEAVRTGADGTFSVAFSVSEKYVVSARIGENPREYRPLTWRPAPITLARQGPVSVVIQAYHTAGKVAIEVVSLAIRGAVPAEK